MAPSPPLDLHVQLIWTLDLDQRANFGPPARILPDGIGEVVFHCGQPFRMRFAGDPMSLQDQAFSISQTHRHFEIEPSGYADQAHFNHDFFAFAGMMPGKSLASRNVVHLEID